MAPLTLQQILSTLHDADLSPEADLPPHAANIALRRVRDDSRNVEPGDLFVAVRGAAADGADHIADALARGAAAVVVENHGSVRMPEGMDRVDIPVVHVTNARIALAELGAASLGYPARQLSLVGITGTVGKTSVLAMLAEILAQAKISAGTIGSLGIRFPGSESTNANTTPGALMMQKALSAIADANVSVAAMEVTSHALAQDRVHGLRFDLGIFTNLTMLEHLEYHGSFRNYAEAKLRFLDTLSPDAPLCYAAGDRVVRQAVRRHTGPRVSCGGGGAWVAVRREPLSLRGTRITLSVRRPLPRLDGGCVEPCTIPLQLQTLGRPNTANATLAATAALMLGAPPAAVQEALSRVEPPARRLQVIRRHAPTIIDDTVGHPDSMTGVFEVAARVPHDALRVVFCIRGRRGEEINARDAEALAIWSRRIHIDHLMVTSGEDTADDRNDVSDGEERAFLDVLRRHSVRHTHHRRVADAIAAALHDAGDGDLVLLLGAQGMDAAAAITRSMLDQNQPH